MSGSVMILAGTTEATALAHRLAEAGVDVLSSFAGVTRTRVRRPGRVRVGGFGGVDGLARVLREEKIGALVDATHPFAARMPHAAADAARIVGIPLLRVLRPPWSEPSPGSWHRVPDVARAAAALRPLGAERVFLTIGRQQLDPFRHLDLRCLVRSIEPPERLPAGWSWIGGGRPLTVGEELDLFQSHRIDTVVTKNAGGSVTRAKLEATPRAGARLVVIDRPAAPTGVPVAPDVDAALTWLDERRA